MRVFQDVSTPQTLLNMFPFQVNLMIKLIFSPQDMDTIVFVTGHGLPIDIIFAGGG